jgi:hypothetical protein
MLLARARAWRRTTERCCLVVRRAVNMHNSRPLTNTQHKFTRPNDSSGGHSQPARDDGRSILSRYQSSVKKVGCAVITAQSLSHPIHQPSCILTLHAADRTRIPQTPYAPD